MTRISFSGKDSDVFSANASRGAILVEFLFIIRINCRSITNADKKHYLLFTGFIILQLYNSFSAVEMSGNTGSIEHEGIVRSSDEESVTVSIISSSAFLGVMREGDVYFLGGE